MQLTRTKTASAGPTGAGRFQIQIRDVARIGRRSGRVLKEQKKPLPWSASRFWCGTCQRPMPYESLSAGGVVCRECFEKVEQARMSDLITRLPDILDHLKPAIRSKVDSGPVVSKLLEVLGGEQLGELYAQKLKDVLDSPHVQFREVRQWLNGAMKLIQRQEQLDRVKETPLGDLTDDELRDKLRPLAIQLMQSDPSFYAEVVGACQNIVSSTATLVAPTTVNSDEIPDDLYAEFSDEPANNPNLPERAEAQ